MLYTKTRSQTKVDRLLLSSSNRFIGSKSQKDGSHFFTHAVTPTLTVVARVPFTPNAWRRVALWRALTRFDARASKRVSTTTFGYYSLCILLDARWSASKQIWFPRHATPRHAFGLNAHYLTLVWFDALTRIDALCVIETSVKRISSI